MTNKMSSSPEVCPCPCPSVSSVISSGLFSSIDTESKAYLLGIIAGSWKPLEPCPLKDGITLKVPACSLMGSLYVLLEELVGPDKEHEKEQQQIEEQTEETEESEKLDIYDDFKDVTFCTIGVSRLYLQAPGLIQQVSSWFRINQPSLPCFPGYSPQTSPDSIQTRQDDESNFQFPFLSSESLQWHFIRGLMDMAGECGENLCQVSLTLPSVDLMTQLEALTKIPHVTSTMGTFVWEENHAVDFMGRLYFQATVYLEDRYQEWMNQCIKPWFSMEEDEPIPAFHFSKDLEAKTPEKARGTDTGYDLYLIRKLKEEHGVSFYDTGIHVCPSPGYYFDLVGRSSISKTGYTLANNIGIIDHGYRGNIIVALRKCVDSAPELTLPIKLVQLIPRKIVYMEMEEVDSLQLSARQDSGGLGSKQFST